MSDLLTIEGLDKTFIRHLAGGQRHPVLRGVALTVRRGASVAIRGRSGSGKSSLLRCIHRTYRPDAGTMRLSVDGATVDLATADDRGVLDARRAALGFATQFLSATPRVAAADLVAETGIERSEAVDLLERLGLPQELAALPPATFSGGERQIVNLARSLARPRPLLLLDEVTAPLDHDRRRRVFAVLRERRAQGATLLAVFHDMPDDHELIDEVVEMRDGRVVGA
jgi:alpha-D-ribose 1-methylphosphonate 5-triphosphate synthase subunit PhnL